MGTIERFDRQHVEGRGEQLPGTKPPFDGVDVHRPPARGVDEDRVRLHGRDCAVVDEAGGLRGERAMQAHHVGPAEELVQGLRPPVPERMLDPRRKPGVVERDPHPEGGGAGGNRKADPAEPDDAEHPPAHPPHGRHRQLLRAPGVVAAKQPPVVRGGAPGEREEQPEGVVRDLEGAVVGGVADRDSAPRACLDVDVVEADAGLHDYLRAPHLGHQVGRQAVAAPAVDDRVGFAQRPGRHLAVARAHDLERDPLARHLPLDVGVVLELGVDDEDAGHGAAPCGPAGRGDFATPISASASSMAARTTSMSLSTRSPMTPMRNVPVAVRRPGKITMSRRSRAS